VSAYSDTAFSTSAYATTAHSFLLSNEPGISPVADHDHPSARKRKSYRVERDNLVEVLVRVQELHTISNKAEAELTQAQIEAEVIPARLNAGKQVRA